MDAETFKMVDGILASARETDERESAMALLEVGVQEGTLKEVALVISGRYCLQHSAVLEWYIETLTRRIQNAKAFRENNVGSQ